MKFLLRIAFWLGLVLLLLPASRSSDSDARKTIAVGALDAAAAASATFSDMLQFCARQPDACAIGAQVAAAAGQQAQAGAKLLYEFLNDKLLTNEWEAAGSRGASTRGESASAAKGSGDTLTNGDLAPDWRGPSKAKDVSQKRARNES